MTETIVVAMSGGVDSSVAALLLAKEGKSVVGVSMQVWDYRNNGGCSSRATCCAPDDFTDARRVAARAGIPYYVFDFEQHFRKEVIDRFIDSYAQGVTPNPCIDCNSKVKFKELRNRALTFGATSIATGHYAQIKKSDAGFHLMRGADDNKDQSYFLYGLSQEELSNTIFPVGHLTKPEVREIAKEAGLVTAEKPESQDICFVSGNAGDFVTQIGGVKKATGKIIRSSGEVVGAHDGVQYFTIGQRKGIKIGGLDEPLYVIEIRPESQSVVVGTKDELERESFVVGELNLISPNIKGESFQALVQVRSRHRGVKVNVRIESQKAYVTFIDAPAVVAPGQAAVFYSLDNTELLGGGRIIKESLMHIQRAA